MITEEYNYNIGAKVTLTPECISPKQDKNKSPELLDENLKQEIIDNAYGINTDQYLQIMEE